MIILKIALILVCTRLFNNTTTRDSHIKLVHKDQVVDTKKFRCNECPAGFEMREELRIHSFIHFEGEIHHCFECNQIFKKKKLLTLHMKMHENPGFACEICNTLFKYKSNLKKHIKKGRCSKSVNNEVDVEKEAILARKQFVEITKNFGRSIIEYEDGEDFEEENVKKKRGRKRKFESLPNYRLNNEVEENSNFSEYTKELKKGEMSSGRPKRDRKIPIKISEGFNKESTKVNQKSKKDKVSEKAKNNTRTSSNMDIEIKSIKENSQEIFITQNSNESLVALNLHPQFELLSEDYNEEHYLDNIENSSEEYKFHRSSSKFKQNNLKASNFENSLEAQCSKSPHRYIKSSEFYKCDLCSFTTIKKSSLLSHIRHHVSSSRHKCKICSESFTSFEKLHKHSLKIHKKGAFGSAEYSKASIECEICNKIFSAERFSAHLNLHQTPKFQCDYCGILFRMKQALERHLKSKHESDRLMTCATCGKNYKKMSLKQHEETHNPVKIYVKCEICQKLMQMKNLKLHIELRHSDRYKEKKIVCECGKAFRYQKQLQKHIEQVHEKVNLGKNYPCMECDFVTTRMSDLRAHSFVHYSGPVFECKICELKFKTKKLLQIHSKVHLDGGLRKYPCSKCQNIFQTTGGRRKHELKVHGNEEEHHVNI